MWLIAGGGILVCIIMVIMELMILMVICGWTKPSTTDIMILNGERRIIITRREYEEI